MIVSNIINNSTFISKKDRFFVVSDNFNDYAGELKKICPQYSEKGMGDHFLGTMRAIENLWLEYRFEDIMEYVRRIENSPCLKSWFATIICMIIYGRKNGSEIYIRSLPLENREYLRIWKNKFISNGTDDNSINTENGLNVYEIKEENSFSIVGCCSKKYFIIPPCEVISSNAEWKESYFRFMKNDVSIENFFTKITDVETEIKLKLSARSMPDDSPLRIVKDIINLYIRLKNNFPENVPAKTICGVNFYCTDGNNIPKKVLKNNIYITQADGEYCSLYPFTEKFADDMENSISSVKSIKMTVIDSSSDIRNKDVVEAVKITATICYNVKFKGDSQESAYIPYLFDERHLYDTQHIRNADNLGTFCMYPDIPLEYESRCKKYTFIYNTQSTIHGHGNPSGNELKEGNYVYLPSGEKLYIRSTEKPVHLLSISLENMEISGYILNLRTLHNAPSPLLFNNRITEIDLRVNQDKPDNKMYAYFDFGSSSSAFGYRINNGILVTDSITGNTPIVRELLAHYDTESYSDYINFGRDVEKTFIVPSANIMLNGLTIEDLWPYHLGFVPFSKKFTNFEKRRLQIDVSHKSELMLGKIHKNTMSIIYNMCYTAVCHAINMNCKEIFIVPSLPNEGYADAYYKLWEVVRKNVQQIFDIKINNLLCAENKHLLYESIAISNGFQGAGNNVLRISVDIGDSTTDMSAVFIKNDCASVCGYSSVNYAGKELLKESLRVMLSTIGKQNNVSVFRDYVKKFILGRGDNHDNPFMVTDNENDVSDITDEICRKFYPNPKRAGRPRNESWQNNFIELFGKAVINVSNGKAVSGKYTGSADIKIKADILMRYAVLMPVIKDFINTALTMCDSDNATAINISFYGGGTNGILLSDAFTAGNNSFLKKMQSYFNKSFIQPCFVEVPDVDAKAQLIKGLSKLDICMTSDGKYNLYLSDNRLFNFTVSWNDIEPTNIYKFNDVRAERCKKFGLVQITSHQQIEQNDINFRKAENYMPAEMCEDFQKYAKNIIDLFISDENLSSFFDNSFITNPLPDTKDSIRELLSSNEKNTAFLNAINSKVYPEMMKNTVYMFAMGKMLSKCFGNGFSGVAVTENPNNEYRYIR